MVRTVLGLLQDTRLRLRCKPLPSLFQRTVNDIFSDRKEKEVMVYVDDTGISTLMEKEHLASLDVIFTVLNSSSAKLNCQNVNLEKHWVKF